MNEALPVVELKTIYFLQLLLLRYMLMKVKYYFRSEVGEVAAFSKIIICNETSCKLAKSLSKFVFYLETTY